MKLMQVGLVTEMLSILVLIGRGTPEVNKPGSIYLVKTIRVLADRDVVGLQVIVQHSSFVDDFEKRYKLDPEL